jgi:PPM family protein phosphatase
MKGFHPKAVEVSWYLRFKDAIRGIFGTPAAAAAPVSAVEDSSASLSLIPGVLKLRVGVVSTVGNYREHNEDNFYVPGRKSVRFDAPPEASAELETLTIDSTNLFLVADGMGGQMAGEQASLMAIQLIPRGLSRRLPPGETDEKVIQKAIREAVAEANHEILGLSATGSEYSSMGTTVVLALFRNDRVFVAGIGDSRAYRLRRGVLEQLTEDHSLADALGKAGTITPAEVPNHKYKNVLYLYLGSKDAREGPEEVRCLDVLPGDRFLMASDGLTGVVSDEELAYVLGTCPDPQQAARQLKELALANQSKDNVTCLVIHVVGAGHDVETSSGLRP